MATETSRLSIVTVTDDEKKVNSSISRVNTAASDANLLTFAQNYNSLQDGTLNAVKVIRTRVVE